MRQDRIEELFERMRDQHGGMNTFIQSEVVNRAIGRSLEAATPVLESAHDRLVGSGAMKLHHGISARTLECPEGPHGGIWRKAVLFYGEGINLLAVMRIGGEPDPHLDAIIRRCFGDKAPTRSSEPGPCRGVKVYQIASPSDVDDALAANVADRWSSLMVLEGRQSMSPYEPGREWMDSSGTGLCGGGGLNAWRPFFAGLDKLFRQTDLLDMMRSSASEMSARVWRSAGAGLDQYAAAAEFGNEMACEDSYLPGSKCLAALDTLDRLSAQAEMERLSVKLATISDGLAAHPALLENSAFDANDGRNVLRPISGTNAAFALELEDQNNRHLVRQIGNRIDVIGQHREGDGEQECLRVSFSADANGRMRMSGVIGQDMNAIHCWNGFVAAVGTLECCVTEEIETLASSPGPK